jgi:hypothetical protein
MLGLVGFIYPSSGLHPWLELGRQTSRTEGSYPRQRFLPTQSHNGDIMVINIHCKSHDNYSERNWHPPAACVEQATRQVRSQSRERGRVRLAWTASISLYRAIRSTKNRGLQQKTSMPTTSMLHFTRVKHLRIDLALIPLKGFAA